MRKWTIIDTMIVVVVAVAAIVGVKVLGGTDKGNSNMKESKVEFLVLANDKEKGFVDSITPGDDIIISLSGKDSGVVKKVEALPANILTFDNIKGEYINNENDEKEDAYICIEAECTEDERNIIIGETIIKVGSYIAVRGKGFATEGHIVKINVGGEE